MVQFDWPYIWAQRKKYRGSIAKCIFFPLLIGIIVRCARISSAAGTSRTNFFAKVSDKEKKTRFSTIGAKTYHPQSMSESFHSRANHCRHWPKSYIYSTFQVRSALTLERNDSSLDWGWYRNLFDVWRSLCSMKADEETAYDAFYWQKVLLNALHWTRYVKLLIFSTFASSCRSIWTSYVSSNHPWLFIHGVW